MLLRRPSRLFRREWLGQRVSDDAPVDDFALGLQFGAKAYAAPWAGT
jgi:hypothetical protein